MCGAVEIYLSNRLCSAMLPRSVFWIDVCLRLTTFKSMGFTASTSSTSRNSLEFD